jgi:hypothetical protein
MANTVVLAGGDLALAETRKICGDLGWTMLAPGPPGFNWALTRKSSSGCVDQSTSTQMCHFHFYFWLPLWAISEGSTKHALRTT